MSAAAAECAGSLRSAAELRDATGADTSAGAGPTRSMAAIRAEALERSQCAFLKPSVPICSPPGALKAARMSGSGPCAHVRHATCAQTPHVRLMGGMVHACRTFHRTMEEAALLGNLVRLADYMLVTGLAGHVVLTAQELLSQLQTQPPELAPKVTPLPSLSCAGVLTRARCAAACIMCLIEEASQRSGCVLQCVFMTTVAFAEEEEKSGVRFSPDAFGVLDVLRSNAVAGAASLVAACPRLLTMRGFAPLYNGRPSTLILAVMIRCASQTCLPIGWAGLASILASGFSSVQSSGSLHGIMKKRYREEKQHYQTATRRQGLVSSTAY